MPRGRKKTSKNQSNLISSKNLRISKTKSTPTRVSQRSLTIKKTALSKAKRKSFDSALRNQKFLWEESDGEYVCEPDYYSQSDVDNENEDDYKSIAMMGMSSDWSNESDISDILSDEYKDKETSIYFADTSEQIFCPWLELSEDQIPSLVLPCSSSDLLVDKDHLFDTLEIYEILRSYCHTIQISPFLFEDFCAALRSATQSKILCDIHIAFLRLLFRDDEDDQTLYSVQDTNNSFNIMLQLLEPMTFGELLRQYVESDSAFSKEILDILNNSNYPFVELEKRLTVLKWLCERFFETNIFKKLINRELKIVHDEHCRDCGRQGDVLLCDGCEACYHLKCTNLEEIPRGKWLCQVCEIHEINGVANCLMLGERDYRFSRRTQPIGFDRHGRIYWFVARRLFIQDTKHDEVYYYSSLPQVYELLSVLDFNYLEKQLCKNLFELISTIADHMRITLELTDERRKNLQIKTQRESPFPYLHVDNIYRMSKIMADIVLYGEESNYRSIIKEENNDYFVENSFVNIKKMNALKTLLGIESGHLKGTLWSGGYCENELLDYHHRLENEFALANSDPNVNENNMLEHLQLTLLEDLQRGYRLGFSDAEYRNYFNHYTINDFAKSPYARAKDRDRKKYMCSKFSLVDEGEFTWVCAKNRDCYTTEIDVAKCIQYTLKKLLEKLTDNLMHRLWKTTDAKQRFLQNLQNSITVETLKNALLQFERVVRKPIFCNVWWNTLGHTKLIRFTSEEREKRQKLDAIKKKEERILMTADTNEKDIVWVKYSFYKGPPRHNIWRLKGEQYRVNGRDKLGGWMWISSTIYREYTDIPLHPRLGISYKTSIETVVTTEDKKAYNLDKLVRCFSIRRHLNEVIKEARQSNCYSPSCRLIALGIRNSITALSSLDGGFRPCYSPSCKRNKVQGYEKTTNEIVKASKSLRANDAQNISKNGIEEIIGEGRPFPFPKIYQYKAQRTKKKSILILPTKSLRKIARQGGLNSTIYIPGFHKQSKSNYNVWNYLCARPLFDNCWRYLTLKSNSLHSLAMQLRIMYACIRWADMEPNENDESNRVWTHHSDSDEVRSVIGHKEYPPDGYYERYKIRVERYGIDDLKGIECDDDSEDYKTNAIKMLRTRVKRKNKNTFKEVYVKRRRNAISEQWIDGVELKVFEIRNYWAKYFEQKRQRIEQLMFHQYPKQSIVYQPYQNKNPELRHQSFTISQRIVSNEMRLPVFNV